MTEVELTRIVLRAQRSTEFTRFKPKGQKYTSYGGYEQVRVYPNISRADGCNMDLPLWADNSDGEFLLHAREDVFALVAEIKRLKGGAL